MATAVTVSLDTPDVMRAAAVAMTDALLIKVNTEVNAAIRYRDDADKDFWEVGGTEGDCEDFAIRKLRDLTRHHGFPRGALTLAAARDLAAAGERAKAGLVRELLSVVDNLERALAAAESGESNLRQGVELVHAELVAVLARSGIEPFDPAGEPFDPTLHEALSMRQQDGSEPGQVLEVVEKGYRMNESVLRPARVVVSG